MTLPELRRLLGQASPAPWEQLPSVVEEARIQSADDARVATLDGRLDLRYRANAALIVALRNDADALLDVVEAVDATHVTDTDHDDWYAVKGDDWDAVQAALARLDGKETP